MQRGLIFPQQRADRSYSPQACRVAVEDRSAGFAHATTLGAPTIAFALPTQSATNTSVRARSAEQPRTPGAFANQVRVVPAPQHGKEETSPLRSEFAARHSIQRPPLSTNKSRVYPSTKSCIDNYDLPSPPLQSTTSVTANLIGPTHASPLNHCVLRQQSPPRARTAWQQPHLRQLAN